MRIQHNITAANAQRQLAGNNNNVSKNLEKLSSGYRINRAGDDAAGLGISEKMRCQIAGLDQAKGNCSDGISLVQTAEGALTEVHAILNRMTELATQASNGTYDDMVDRPNLQKEVDNLLGEVDRIAQYTNFNGMSLLDGSLSGAGGGGGALNGAPIYGVKAASAATAPGDTTGVNFDTPETINIDGVEIRVNWSVLDSFQRGALNKDLSAATGDEMKEAAAAIQTAVNKAISKNNAGGGPQVQGISVRPDLADLTKLRFTSSKPDNSSKIVVKSGSSGVLGTMFNAGAADVPLAAPSNHAKFQPADVEGDFTMTLGGQNLKVTMGALPGGSTDPDDVVATLQAGIDDALAKYDTARGTAGTDAYAGKINVRFGDDGNIEFTNATGESLAFSDTPGNEFAKNLGISTEAKATAGGGLTLQVGDTADDYNKVTVSVGDMRSASLGLVNIRVDTQESSIASIPKIKDAIDKISGTRGDLGAIQNRLEHTVNNLGVTSENMTASESRIRDADMAQEMMSFTKNNILSQAAQSMLSQAQQLPQGVLQLLQYG